jgi:hypothetical protein
MNAKYDAAGTLEWALDTLRRYAPDPLAESDYELAQFQRQCERDEAERERMERDDRIEAERYGVDREYYEYAMDQAGARRW